MRDATDGHRFFCVNGILCRSEGADGAFAPSDVFGDIMPSTVYGAALLSDRQERRDLERRTQVAAGRAPAPKGSVHGGGSAAVAELFGDFMWCDSITTPFTSEEEQKRKLASSGDARNVAVISNALTADPDAVSAKLFQSVSDGVIVDCVSRVHWDAGIGHMLVPTLMAKGTSAALTRRNDAEQGGHHHNEEGTGEWIFKQNKHYERGLFHKIRVEGALRLWHDAPAAMCHVAEPCWERSAAETYYGRDGSAIHMLGESACDLAATYTAAEVLASRATLQAKSEMQRAAMIHSASPTHLSGTSTPDRLPQPSVAKLFRLSTPSQRCWRVGEFSCIAAYSCGAMLRSKRKKTPSSDVCHVVSSLSDNGSAIDEGTAGGNCLSPKDATKKSVPLFKQFAKNYHHLGIIATPKEAAAGRTEAPPSLTRSSRSGSIRAALSAYRFHLAHSASDLLLTGSSKITLTLEEATAAYFSLMSNASSRSVIMERLEAIANGSLSSRVEKWASADRVKEEGATSVCRRERSSESDNSCDDTVAAQFLRRVYHYRNVANEHVAFKLDPQLAEMEDSTLLQGALSLLRGPSHLGSGVDCVGGPQPCLHPAVFQSWLGLLAAEGIVSPHSYLMMGGDMLQHSAAATNFFYQLQHGGGVWCPLQVLLKGGTQLWITVRMRLTPPSSTPNDDDDPTETPIHLEVYDASTSPKDSGDLDEELGEASLGAVSALAEWVRAQIRSTMLLLEEPEFDARDNQDDKMKRRRTEKNAKAAPKHAEPKKSTFTFVERVAECPWNVYFIHDDIATQAIEARQCSGIAALQRITSAAMDMDFETVAKAATEESLLFVLFAIPCTPESQRLRLVEALPLFLM